MATTNSFDFVDGNEDIRDNLGVDPATADILFMVFSIWNGIMFTAIMVFILKQTNFLQQIHKSQGDQTKAAKSTSSHRKRKNRGMLGKLKKQPSKLSKKSRESQRMKNAESKHTQRSFRREDAFQDSSEDELKEKSRRQSRRRSSKKKMSP